MRKDVNVQLTMDNEQCGKTQCARPLTHNSSFITHNYILCCLLFAVAANSCMVGPNFQHTKDAIDSTEVYRYDSLQLAMTDSVLNIKWWEMFQDPIIDTLISIGLAENKDVLIASARIEQARAALGKAKAEIWPSFGYSPEPRKGAISSRAVLPEGEVQPIFSLGLVPSIGRSISGANSVGPAKQPGQNYWPQNTGKERSK